MCKTAEEKVKLLDLSQIKTCCLLASLSTIPRCASIDGSSIRYLEAGDVAIELQKSFVQHILSIELPTSLYIDFGDFLDQLGL